MSVMKKGGNWHLMFRPKGELIGVTTMAQSRTEAKQIETAILMACRSDRYDFLEPNAREACVRMFKNRGWTIPADLSVDATAAQNQELTLWRACQIFLNYPEVKASPGLWRHEYSITNLVAKLGKEKPLKSIWVPDLKQYQIDRTGEGAAPDTVNRELSTLSRLFSVMIELQYWDANPVRMVKSLSNKSGLRQVYLSHSTVNAIIGSCPDWAKPLLWTAYYTGMRRGEVLNLTRKQIDLSKRIILLSPDGTKEGDWKRVPIHQALVPILEACVKRPVFSISGKVFDVNLETFKNVWPRACDSLKEKGVLTDPLPRFHDLRHTWKTNARRSGMDSEIREVIMGHSIKTSVRERYGRISNDELLQAIDLMTFDHGDTEIWVAKANGKQR